MLITSRFLKFLSRDSLRFARYPQWGCGWEDPYGFGRGWMLRVGNRLADHRVTWGWETGTGLRRPPLVEQPRETPINRPRRIRSGLGAMGLARDWQAECAGQPSQRFSHTPFLFFRIGFLQLRHLLTAVPSVMEMLLRFGI